MPMDFNPLRKKHPELIYNGFETVYKGDNLKIYFDFRLAPNIKFKPEIILPSVPENLDQNVLNNLVFNLGMVELLSYWKATCSPKIIIKAGYLDEEQINFWKNLLIKGLGEFFYNNKIDFTKKDFVEFSLTPRTWANRPRRWKAKSFKGKLQDRDLILVGGGKDSAVTLDSISRSGKEFNCLMLNPTQAAQDITQAGGCRSPIIIKRTIDPRLLELNKQGYLNGHTPFSAYLAFLGTLTGVLYDYKNIIVSNESSSNEMNILWRGQEVNHQYSKTSEFEKDFQEYSQKYLAAINYYSYIRQYGELEISEMFSKMEKYHKIFRSCNKGARKGIWCGKCPKCVSTFITLYPFLGEQTVEIFGKNLLKDKSLKPIIKGLMGKNNSVKPFECVATYAEIKRALDLVGYETKGL